MLHLGILNANRVSIRKCNGTYLHEYAGLPDIKGANQYWIRACQTMASCVCDLGGRKNPKSIIPHLIRVILNGPDGAYLEYYNENTLPEWSEELSSYKVAMQFKMN